MSESMNTVYITNINIVLKSTPQKVSILITIGFVETLNMNVSLNNYMAPIALLFMYHLVCHLMNL